jgi:hypothetical protein
MLADNQQDGKEISMRDVFEANESRMMLYASIARLRRIAGAAEKASTALHSLITDRKNVPLS